MPRSKCIVIQNKYENVPLVIIKHMLSKQNLSTIPILACNSEVKWYIKQ